MDLFEAMKEETRQELRRRGWFEAAGKLFGAMMWRNPEGSHFTEEEAFAWLYREQLKESKR